MNTRSLFPCFLSTALAAAATAQTTYYVDDDGAGDPFPGVSIPGNPAFSDPLEDGSEEHPFDDVEKAVIDQDLCIKCGRCHIVCEDASHQAITQTVNGERKFEVIDEECVGCNLCTTVCPVDGCISMEQMTEGVDPRTGQKITTDKLDWTRHPNNPMCKDS